MGNAIANGGPGWGPSDTTLTCIVRRLVLLLLVALFGAACTDGDSDAAPWEPTTTIPEEPCTVESGCLPPECGALTMEADPWTLYSLRGAAGTHRISSRVVVSAADGCAEVDDSRIALQGLLEGADADLFGEREGAIGYQLVDVDGVDRELTMVVHCDGELPEVGVMATPAVGDDEAVPIVESIPVADEDCSRTDPASGFSSCGIELEAEIREVVRGVEEVPAAAVTVSLVGPSCPDPSGLLEPVYLAEIYADNRFSDDPWKYQSSEGTPGVLMAPGEPDTAEYVWRCGRTGRVFPAVDFEVVAFFQDQQFATESITLESVPCNLIVEEEPADEEQADSDSG